MLKFLLWSLGIAFVLGAIVSNNTPPPKALTKAEQAAIARGDDLAHLAHNLRRSLESQMRNPDSFEIMEARANLKTGAVCLKYRAQNGFGGMNIERAGLREGDTDIMTQGHPDFPELWGECMGLGSVGGDAIYKIRG